MHGAFFDIVVFSHDDKIAEISRMRLRQSMEIAKRIGVKAVIFHTNANPMLAGEIYDNNVIEKHLKALSDKENWQEIYKKITEDIQRERS